MTTQLEILDILEDSGILGDIRQRLGAKDEDDTSQDAEIMQLDARSLTAVAYGWELGDDSWGYNIIDLYESLKQAGL